MGLKLGDISPIAGILTGEGAIGKIAGEGMLGLGPKFIANQAQDEDERKEKEKKARRGTAAQQIDSTTTAPAYKKGGMVKSKASSRADGCAKRGKTRGRMV
jgi:hypothetical protein